MDGLQKSFIFLLIYVYRILQKDQATIEGGRAGPLQIVPEEHSLGGAHLALPDGRSVFKCTRASSAGSAPPC